MMQMTFGWSSSVTLLFDFWNVDGPGGMVLSVFVVLMLTILFEVLKVFRMWLGSGFMPEQHQSEAPTAPASRGSECCSVLDPSPSQTSLSPLEPRPRTGCSRSRWLMHVVQTLLHVLQVTLGYMLMLCVMSYNSWIFIGVIVGSALGYFLSFPLLDHMCYYGPANK